MIDGIPVVVDALVGLGIWGLSLHPGRRDPFSRASPRSSSRRSLRCVAKVTWTQSIDSLGLSNYVECGIVCERILVPVSIRLKKNCLTQVQVFYVTPGGKKVLAPGFDSPLGQGSSRFVPRIDVAVRCKASWWKPILRLRRTAPTLPERARSRGSSIQTRGSLSTTTTRGCTFLYAAMTSENALIRQNALSYASTQAKPQVRSCVRRSPASSRA